MNERRESAALLRILESKRVTLGAVVSDGEADGRCLIFRQDERIFKKDVKDTYYNLHLRHHV